MSYEKYNQIILNNIKSIDTIANKILKLNPRFDTEKYKVDIKYDTGDDEKINRTYDKSNNKLNSIKKLYEEYILNFDYESVIKRTKIYNDANKNNEIRILLETAGKPYDYVVYDFTKLNEDNYIISANPYKMKSGEVMRTLTFNLQYSGNFNEFDNTIKNYNLEFKDILKDCYDNVILIDLGFDVIFAVEQLPMYKYFSILENPKNNFLLITPYHYQDDKVYRFIYKNTEDSNRERWDLLDYIDFDGKDKFISYYNKY